MQLRKKNEMNESESESCDVDEKKDEMDLKKIDEMNEIESCDVDEKKDAMDRSGKCHEIKENK